MSKASVIDLNSEIQKRCNLKLVQRMHRLQMDESFHDVYLIYPNSTERISSVKKLLSTHSDYFKNEFYCKRNGPNELILTFSDEIPISIFKMLHNYIFTASLDIESISLENQIKLFRLAKFYQFEDVTYFIVEYFILKISIDICWDLLNLSAEFTEEHLGDVCAKVIAQLPDLLTNSKLLSLNALALEFLFRRNTFTLPEEELVKIKKAWMMSNARALQIYKLKDNKYQFDLNAVNSILDKIGDCYVSIYSINGPSRTGKSLLLNFFLRYLMNDNDWLNDDLIIETNSTIQFDWGGGSERKTTGIYMWSEPFIKIKPDGSRVAVLLMDTQGIFDDKSTLQDNCIIFALSSLISSYMIFNIQNQLSEEKLQFLHLFSGYSLFGNENFVYDGLRQKLMFVIRDWCSIDYEFGYYDDNSTIDGKNFKIDKLDATSMGDDLPINVKFIREEIASMYDVSCYLMPHPGNRVARRAQFNARLVDSEFLDYLKTLVPLLFNNGAIVNKKNGRYDMTGNELRNFIINLSQKFISKKLPEIISLSETSAEVQYMIAKKAAVDNYYINMSNILMNDDLPVMDDNQLLEKHNEYIKESFGLYNSFPRLHKDEYDKVYTDTIRKEIDEKFQFFKDMYTLKLKNKQFDREVWDRNMEKKKYEMIKHVLQFGLDVLAFLLPMKFRN